MLFQRALPPKKAHGSDHGKDRGEEVMDFHQFQILHAAGVGRHLLIVDDDDRIRELLKEFLAREGYRVTGVDSASAMIARCREAFPTQRWINADMRSLALDQRFDGILAWNSFFHLGHDDQRAMFSIFARHAKPGAPLMFTSGPSHGEAIGSLYGEALFHASLDPTEYRALLAQNGLAEIAHVVEDPTCGRHTIWLAQATA